MLGLKLFVEMFSNDSSPLPSEFSCKNCNYIFFFDFLKQMLKPRSNTFLCLCLKVFS